MGSRSPAWRSTLPNSPPLQADSSCRLKGREAVLMAMRRALNDNRKLILWPVEITMAVTYTSLGTPPFGDFRLPHVSLLRLP
jgi:hypothetical protein